MEAAIQRYSAWKTMRARQGLWELIGKPLREQGRVSAGRNATPTVAMLASSVKTAREGPAATMQASRSKPKRAFCLLHFP